MLEIITQQFYDDIYNEWMNNFLIFIVLHKQYIKCSHLHRNVNFETQESNFMEKENVCLCVCICTYICIYMTGGMEREDKGKSTV